MTQDWITADLKSAQLAIVAKLWEVPTLEDYLRSGKSIWPDLCKHMGIEFTAENKAIMKTILYALIFGAGNQRLRSMLGKHFDNAADSFRRLKGHPVMRSLILARYRQLKKIRKDAGAEDAFGNWTDITKTRKSGYDYDYDNARSILACVAQSYELKLLLPVIRMAVAEQFSDHGFTLTTWLHDGFTFDVHHVRDKEAWIERLFLAVRQEADFMGITTELEFS